MIEDSVVRTISELRVQYEQPIKAMDQLSERATRLNQQLQGLNVTVGQLNQTMGASTSREIRSTDQILDRHGRTIGNVGQQMNRLDTHTRQFNEHLRDHGRVVQETAQSWSVLGSQWERRISWFVAGVGFYGGMRAMRSAIDIFTQVESDMTVVARTTTDLTFQMEHMRDSLMALGRDFGHTWDTVADVAIQWTRAGYDMNETLELVRTSLLALNVAEMDVADASEGLIAIMAQWDLEASDLVEVIDKLNITSDNYAITTGDLVDALKLASGAARAVNMTFDETVGVITATRVATGQTGRAVGTAIRTILSYLYRQQTINTLMEHGIEVFADAAETKLRPAIDVIADISDKWLDNAEQMPEQLVEIAEQVGIMGEEMAQAADLQKEWTDLQKVEIETAAAGVRRRNYLIALMRNFGMVTEVVTNLQDAHGYSMMQNVMAMETLEKQAEAMRMSFQELAVAMGDAGLLGDLKVLVDGITGVTTAVVELDRNILTFAMNLGITFTAIKVFTTLLGMAGIKLTALAKIAPLAFLGPKGWVAILALAGASALTLSVQSRRATDELEQQQEMVYHVAQEYDSLRERLDRAVEGSSEYELIQERLRSLTQGMAEIMPDLIQGYDAQHDYIKLNAGAMREMSDEWERQQDIAQDSMDEHEKFMESLGQEADMHEEMAQRYREDARRISGLAGQRQVLIDSLEDESLSSEELADRKRRLEEVDRALIAVTQDYTDIIQEHGEITTSVIDSIIEKIEERAEKDETATREAIQRDIEKTRAMLDNARRRAVAYEMDLRMMRQQVSVQEDVLDAARDLRWEEAFPGMEGVPGIYPDIAARAHRDMAKSQEALEGYQEEVGKTSQQINQYMQELDDLRRRLADASAGLGDVGDVTEDTTADTEKAASAARSLADKMRAYVDEAMQFVRVQERANAALRRSIDAIEAKIAYMVREAATQDQRLAGLRSESDLLRLQSSLQESVSLKSDLLREAKERLIKRQQELNTSTSEGKEAYSVLQGEIDSIRDSIVSLEQEWWSLEQAQETGISNLEKLREMRRVEAESIEAKIDFLTREHASVEEVAEAEILRSQIVATLNEKLADNEGKIRAQVQWQDRLAQELEDGNITQRQYNNAIVESERNIADLRSANRDYIQTIEEMRSGHYRLEGSIANIERAFEKMGDTIQFVSRLGIASTRQLIEYTRTAYRQLASQRDLTLEEERSKILELHGLYKDKFDEMRQSAEEAYRRRLDALDVAVQREVDMIQRRIDALDEERKLRDREETRRRHEERLQDLHEDRKYHELRTGIEHHRAIQDIDRQIADEERRWEQTKQDWIIQEKREALQQQIQDVHDAAEAQRQVLQEAYERMQADFDSAIVDILATAAAYDEDFFEDARRKGELWAKGFLHGISGILAGDHLGGLVDAARETIPETGLAEGARDTKTGTIGDTREKIHYIHEPQYELDAGRAYMPARTLASIIGKNIGWDDQTREVIIGGHRFSPYRIQDGRAWVGIRDVGQRLGYDVSWMNGSVRLAKQAHQGAMTLTHGIARLKPGELIFPPDLSHQMNRLLDLLSQRPLQPQVMERGRTLQFNAPLFNVEEQILRDEVDAEGVSRELMRQVNLFST